MSLSLINNTVAHKFSRIVIGGTSLYFVAGPTFENTKSVVTIAPNVTTSAASPHTNKLNVCRRCKTKAMTWISGGTRSQLLSPRKQCKLRTWSQIRITCRIPIRFTAFLMLPPLYSRKRNQWVSVQYLFNFIDLLLGLLIYLKSVSRGYYNICITQVQSFKGDRSLQSVEQLIWKRFKKFVRSQCPLPLFKLGCLSEINLRHLGVTKYKFHIN